MQPKKSKSGVFLSEEIIIFVGMKAKNKYGQYFTEAPVADFMVSLISHGTDCRVLEPSCGKGVFLKKLSEYGFRNVSAYEIDVTLDNGFDCVKYKSFVTSPLSEQFDVIIGNPPYIRWKNLESELKDELQDSVLWKQHFNSLCDYLFIFILKSIEQLKEGGELIFVCSDYWMNTTHSQTLRNYMCIHGYFEQIYHFQEAPLFENVNASFVIFRYIKTSHPPRQNICLYTYNKKGKPGSDELHDGSCFDFQEIPRFEKNKRWLLADEQMQQELAAFEKACSKNEDLFNVELHRLGDVCDIGNGMVSGLDAAFKINAEEESTLNETERGCLINVLKAKNLSPFVYDSTEKYIYMPAGLDEDVFKKRYPHFATHFKEYREKLYKRYSYGRELPYWEFAFSRNRKLFERNCPKIFIPCKERISHKCYFRFCYSPEGFYPLQDVTGIVRKETCRETTEYILAYLNNYRVFDWLRYNGIVKGQIVEFSEAPIASIPYLTIDWKNPVEVELHEGITTETRLFLSDRDENHKSKINELFNRLFHEKSRF